MMMIHNPNDWSRNGGASLPAISLFAELRSILPIINYTNDPNFDNLDNNYGQNIQTLGMSPLPSLMQTQNDDDDEDGDNDTDAKNTLNTDFDNNSIAIIFPIYNTTYNTRINKNSKELEDNMCNSDLSPTKCNCMPKAINTINLKVEYQVTD